MAYGSRIDIDDYNRNTHQGLHVTSMSAAWMNIVYGFGGMRSDGEILAFSPKLPHSWNGYTFTITVRNSVLKVTVKRNRSFFRILKGDAVIVKIYQKEYTITEEGVEVANKHS